MLLLHLLIVLLCTIISLQDVGNMSRTDRFALEVAFTDTYNAMTFDNCDAPTFRRVVNASLFGDDTRRANFTLDSEGRRRLQANQLFFDVQVEAEDCVTTLFDTEEDGLVRVLNL